MSRPATPPEPDTDSLGALEERLGHAFRSRARLAEALTHGSVAGQGDAAAPSYERLEFLGDRVLGLVVADLLLEAFPGEDEGSLARRHAALVRRETLAMVADEIGLGDALRLSRGEDEAGGRTNPGLLADACEAVIGALYRDGGFAAAAAFVRRHWQPLAERDAQPPQDPKTALQEWAQGRGLPLPAYREVGREGPAHAPRFAMEVAVKGYAPVVGFGPSKRAAERSAALAMLDALGARGRD